MQKGKLCQEGLIFPYGVELTYTNFLERLTPMRFAKSTKRKGEYVSGIFIPGQAVTTKEFYSTSKI